MLSEQKQHPEWERENTLTSPSDRDPTKQMEGDQDAPKLTKEEVSLAMKELNNTSFTTKFPKLERRYADPPVELQKYGLISWVPAKGATPNENGVYGFAKMRGNFATSTEANERAEYLIRKVDSYHQIYHAYVGRPFPLTNDPKYSQERKEIDIRKDMSESISNNVKNKREEEKNTVEEMKEREKELLEDTTDKKEEDPEELYTTLRVKKAQITWTYLETTKKLEEMKDIILKTRKEILDMENENSEYKEKYFQKYMNAREKAGLSRSQHEDNFMKFLVDDGDKELGF